MERMNVTLTENLLERIDEVYEERGYNSRAEFIRDAARERIRSERAARLHTEAN